MQPSPHICFENECCSIEQDHVTPCLILNWKGLLPSKPFREVHMEALNLMRKHSFCKMLGDARRMKTSGSEDARWIETFWLPSALATGYSHVAIVESDYVFNQQSIYNIIDKIPSGLLDIALFKERESALYWLRTH